MVSDEQILALVRENGLSRVESALYALRRPSIRLIAHSAECAGRKVPVGGTQIGGHPDLPRGLAWPRWKNLPLGFLAQINLAEVRALDVDGVLPPEGMLYFFYEAKDQPWGYDPRDRGKWRVLYAPAVHGVGAAQAGDLRRTAPPDDLPEESEFPGCVVRVESEQTMPPEDAAAVLGLELTKEERYAYFDLLDGLGELFTAEEDYASHRLLGHPEAVQGDMQLQCQLVSHGLSVGDMTWQQDPRTEALRPGAGEWRLLLQLGSDDEAGDFLWGDDGRLYFWIRESDLAARNFEDVWVVLQCM